MITKPQTGMVLRREGVINAIEQIESVNRVVSVAFSSELPVLTYFGYEILSHDTDSVDLSRLNDGAPVLLQHDEKEQIGVVQSATIDSDRVGRATLKFSRNEDASEIWMDIVDGIRKKISVGYIVTEYSPGSTPSEFIATKWQPIEISIVSIPADNTVGVGRSINLNNAGELDMTQKAGKVVTETVETTEVQPQVQTEDLVSTRNSIINETRELELNRIKAINTIAQRHNISHIAQEFISSGKSPEEFTSIALEEVSKRNKMVIPATHLDMPEKDVSKYSLIKAIRALSNDNWKGAELELESSVAIAQKLGKDARGFFVPWEVQVRAQNVTTASAGGYLVATNTLTGSFVDILRAKSVVIGLGATMLNGLVGNIDVPKQTGASTAYWVAEDGNGTDSQLVFGNLAFSPKTVASAVPITRRMLMQTDMSIDMLITNDIANSIALAIDLAILEGDGVNKPTGIVSTAGVNTQTITTAGSPTWAELVGFETAIDSDNALAGNIAYVTTPSVKGNLKTTKKDSGSGIFLMDGDMANGYRVATTTQLTANRIIFGNFGDVIIANWGVLDIMKDTSTKAASGGIVIRAFQDVDAGVRNAVSFCINA